MSKIICFVLISFFSLELMAQEKDLDIIKSNIKELYLSVLNDDINLLTRIDYIINNAGNPDIMIRELKEKDSSERIKFYLENLNEDGSWSDIDYTDKSRSGWSPSFHAERLKEMAKVYSIAGSDFYKDSLVCEAIHRGFDYWFKGDFVCPNWWYNQIGTPRILGTAFILMEDKLSVYEKENAIKYMSNAKIGMTGQNRAWLAENVLIRLLLENDESSIKSIRNVIFSELKVNHDGEGIKPDMSFHQHGAQQQFGNYGLAFLNTMTYWARVFHGTHMALDDEEMRILRNYLLDGMQWVIWKRYMDISSCGRQLFKNSQEGKSLSVGKAIKNMMIADPEYCNEYSSFYNSNILVDGTSNPLMGNRYFNYSDYGIHRTGNWMSSLKMSSTRVIGSEVVNRENLLGHYLGFGALYIYRDGNEYEDIFPVWDWTRIPGTTSYTSEETMKKVSSFRNNHDFVGGLSDGEKGIGAMILETENLTANKSYFFPGDRIICIGSEITGNLDEEVVTTINQCLSREDVKYMVGKKQKVYILHNGVTYSLYGRFPLAYSKVKSGNWKRVADFYDTTYVEKEVFSNYFSHGVKPKSAKYAYTIFPENASNEGVKILSDKDGVHAIGKDDLYQIVFFKNSTVKLNRRLNVGVDKGCILMIDFKDGIVKISMSEPTQKEEKVTLKISGEWRGEGVIYDKKKKESIVVFDTKGMKGETLFIDLY